MTGKQQASLKFRKKGVVSPVGCFGQVLHGLSISAAFWVCTLTHLFQPAHLLLQLLHDKIWILCHGVSLILIHTHTHTHTHTLTHTCIHLHTHSSTHKLHYHKHYYYHHYYNYYYLYFYHVAPHTHTQHTHTHMHTHTHTHTHTHSHPVVASSQLKVSVSVGNSVLQYVDGVVS